MKTRSPFVITAAASLTRSLMLQAVEALDEAEAPDDGMRWGLLTPRQWSIALTIPEFASADFVGGIVPGVSRNRTRNWLGVKWLRYPGLPGTASANAACYVFYTRRIWGGICNLWVDAEHTVEIRVDDTATIPA